MSTYNGHEIEHAVDLTHVVVLDGMAQPGRPTLALAAQGVGKHAAVQLSSLVWGLPVEGPVRSEDGKAALDVVWVHLKRGRGRLRKSDASGPPLSVRLSPAAREQLRARAVALDVSESDAARLAIQAWLRIGTP